MANKPAPVTDAEHLCLDTVLSLHEELARYREVLRLWNDHLPGCSGSPRCECGYAEARALLGEVPDAK